MMTCKQCRDLMIDALYDELTADEQPQFETHLKECQSCAAEYGKLSSTLRIMDQREQSQPGEEFWNTYWDKLAKRITPQANPKRAPQKTRVWKISALFESSRSIRIAAAAAILLTGILIGRFFLGESGPDHSLATNGNTTDAVVQQTALETRTQEYLEKSKVLLLGLVNLEPEQLNKEAIDFASYQRVSRGLVQEANYLKVALDNPRQQRLRELVNDLEVILLQIANLEAQNDVSAIEIVRSGVDRRGIMLKINLEEMRRAGRTGERKSESRGPAI